MKKQKFNPELLKEEIKRFNLLNEYDFYQEKKEAPEYKDLILGDLEEANDNAPADLEPADDANAFADANGADDNTGETTGEIPEPQAAEPQATEPAPADTASTEPASDEEEIDVTSLVNGSKEAKHAADVASHNSELLLQKLADLEHRVASMDKVGAKIEDLEKEIIKRNPTPVEKLEMRSLSSYPYSQKLTDYWADKEGAYDVMDKNKEKKEYVLTQKDVDADYSDSDIKKSFEVKPEQTPYEEEDI